MASTEAVSNVSWGFLQMPNYHPCRPSGAAHVIVRKRIELLPYLIVTPASVTAVRRHRTFRLSPRLIALQGYSVIRCDRVGRLGGGVCAYIREELTFTIVSSSAAPLPQGGPEFLFFELSVLSKVKILLGVVYRTPKIGFTATFESALTTIFQDYGHKIMFGDWNTDLCSRHPDAEYLRRTFAGLDLHLVPYSPTHHTLTSSTWIDLGIVELSAVITYGQMAVPFLSNHDLIYLEYCLPISSRLPIVRRCLRDLRRLDDELFSSRLDSLDWSAVLSSVDVGSASLLLQFRALRSKVKAELAKARTSSGDASLLLGSMHFDDKQFHFADISPLVLLENLFFRLSSVAGSDGISGRILHQCVETLFPEDINNVASWVSGQGLLLNSSKTKAMILGSARYINALDLSSVRHISVDGVDITFSSLVKNLLGICMTPTLSWREQVTQISKRVSRTLYQLRIGKDFLSIRLKKILVLCKK
ncbi:hypothetical protein KPH14_001072 [Odynerus spinipes]|uniref:Endonuclease/exonuclease/phosphatase domain-containing protein n=1 Tax=Odynerus spinipes TaxID=1348599 RepID=A0AAD9R8Y2_9HYME|nr:hypothetical protein KPH14_001072 [Odynerus spinipes]